MGCATSKVDDLPAVALCRHRCASLSEAIDHRFAFADSHLAYIYSLQLIGRSLHNFIQHDLAGSPDVPPFPILNLPPAKKGDPAPAAPPSKPPLAHRHSHSGSGSGSHLKLHSDSDEDDDSGSHFLHHSDHSSPLHSHDGGPIEYMPPEQYSNYHETNFPAGFMHMNYMMNKATPSVVYEQRPMRPETMYRGEASSSSYYPYSNNTNNNPGPSSYPYYAYSNYSSYNNYPPYGPSSSPPTAARASSSKPPPPPPSPPRSSPWDYLNPFDYDKYYPPYTPSRDLREVREEEGIPDLEDEDYQHEVVKEVHGDQKFADAGSYSKSPLDEEEGKVLDGDSQASLYQARPSTGMENDSVEYEVHVVDKKVVDDERPEGNRARAVPRDAFEVAREIEVQFMRASESGMEIAKMLEVGKLPYQRKHVSSNMLQSVTPSLSVISSLPSTSTTAEFSSSTTAESSSSADNNDPALLDFHEDLAMRSGNLSSTMQKLHLWEKKLYNEVKVEEKMRVAHERKCHKLKRLDEKGAEAHKVDTTRAVIRSLSTKIRIEIQVIDKISVTINKIRDEELWPQLNELIQGLTRMWRSMLECHQNQYQAIREAKGLGSIGSGKKLGDAHLEATLQLERELINWVSRFSSWIHAQKGYVKALNSWLLKCLLYEPEDTPDGRPPFSPSRMGAPLVFVICNQWSDALERLSEKEVVEAMRVFAMSVLQLWEQDKVEMRQKMTVNRDLERKVRNLDREDQKIQKEMQALDKKIVLASGNGNNLPISGHVVYQSDTSSESLHCCLQRIFESMERFTAESLKVYEDLLQRTEEVRIARDHGRVS